MEKGDSGIVYLDYAAATPVDPRVIEAMAPFWSTHYGNAGSLHAEGVLAKEALTASRKTCAELLGAREEEVIFTGSGTESNNLAIFGTVRILEEEGIKVKDMHFITSSIEHPSVLDCFKDLELRGANVTYLPVKESGRVNPNELKAELRENTVLVSIMYVNNEMGAIQPIEEIAKVIKDHMKKEKEATVRFHTDASQAALLLDLDVQTLGVDMLTLDAQKIYGPKGVGLLYKGRKTLLRPIMMGGSQEFGLRPSTENIPGIVGFAKAFSIVTEEQEAETARLKELRDYCIEKIQKELPSGVINGPTREGLRYRTVNNVNVSFPEVEGEYLVIALSDRGFACGTRSACIAGGGPSYVVTAMGRRALASNSLRISLGRYSKKEDIDGLISAIREIV